MPVKEFIFRVNHTVIGAAGSETGDHNAPTPYRTIPVREVSELMAV